MNRSEAGKLAQQKIREKYTEEEISEMRSRAGDKAGEVLSKRTKEYWSAMGKKGAEARRKKNE